MRVVVQDDDEEAQAGATAQTDPHADSETLMVDAVDVPRAPPLAVRPVEDPEWVLHR